MEKEKINKYIGKDNILPYVKNKEIYLQKINNIDNIWMIMYPSGYSHNLIL